jgi:hypothetical protein
MNEELMAALDEAMAAIQRAKDAIGGEQEEEAAAPTQERGGMANALGLG